MTDKWGPNPFAIPRAPEGTCTNCGKAIVSAGQSKTGWTHWETGNRSYINCRGGLGSALPKAKA